MSQASRTVLKGKQTSGAPRLASSIKRILVPSGKQPRRIKTGPFKGLEMNFDLRHDMQMWLGLSERELFPYINAFLPNAHTGIDIGTLEGEFALLFLSKPHIRHVLAFDPSPRFPGDLNANLALNGLAGDPRLQSIKKFVGSRDDNHRCSLDSLSVLRLPGPFIIKVDVEGGEADLLRGSQSLLNGVEVFWVIETHTAGLEIECRELLQSKGFQTRVVRNAWWRIILPEKRDGIHNRWLVGWNRSGLRL
jgi:hypothetical protein